jgi:hypothetical protein
LCKLFVTFLCKCYDANSLKFGYNNAYIFRCLSIHIMQKQASLTHSSHYQSSNYSSDKDDDSDDSDDSNDNSDFFGKSISTFTTPEKAGLPYLIKNKLIEDIKATGGISNTKYRKISNHHPQFYDKFNKKERKQIQNQLARWKQEHKDKKERTLGKKSNITSPSTTVNLVSFPSITSPLRRSNDSMNDHLSNSSVRAAIQAERLLTHGFNINAVGAY